MRKLLYLAYFIIISPLFSISQNKELIDNSNFIIDTKIKNKLNQALFENYNKNKTVKMSVFYKQLNNNTVKLNLKSKFNKKKLTNSQLYNNCKKSVLIIGKLFKYKEKEELFTYIATSFIISKEGYCVTNHHVFEPSKNKNIKFVAAMAMDFYGNTYIIKEVCAAKENDDLAIFKIDTKEKELLPLNLGKMPQIGSDVHVISHPKSLFYKYSKGIVSRYFLYEKEKSYRMSITADFAVGSSGGPILNNYGQVVGIVASTFFVPNKQNTQMIVKEIIPIKSLKNLIR